jgi:hypothetical protein
MGLKGPVKEGFEVSVPFARYVGRQSSMYFQPVSGPNIKRDDSQHEKNLMLDSLILPSRTLLI